jgi:hypothetical protein
MTKSTGKQVNRVRIPDIHSAAAVKEFDRAAKAWGKEATKSQATARQTLVDLGIYTKSGKLSKNYQS